MAAADIDAFCERVIRRIEERKKRVEEMVLSGKLEDRMYRRLGGQLAGYAEAMEDLRASVVAWTRDATDEDFFNRED